MTSRQASYELVRAVVDPGVLVSALITRHGTGAPANILKALLDDHFTMLVSAKLLDELYGVLKREKFRRYVTLDQVISYMEVIRASSVLVEDPPMPAVQITPDRGDDYIILLAQSANAHVVVSGDSHLEGFIHDSVQVVRPIEFLAMIGR